MKRRRIVKYFKQVMNNYTTIFDVRTNSREIIDVFPDLTKPLSPAFSYCLSEVFQTLHHINLAWGIQFIIDLITLTMFQGNSCNRIISCIPFIFSGCFLFVCFLDSCLS